jgi:seryl-tRNA synthetase
MIDLNKLRENTKHFKELILRKEPTFNIDQLIILDQEVKSTKSHLEQLRKEKNDLAAQGAHGITLELRKKGADLNEKIKAQELLLEEKDKALNVLLLSCPNLPQEDLPLGNKEANKPIKIVGSKKEFSFVPKHHVDLNERAGWFDFQTAASMSGAQFALYRGVGVKVIYALTRLMLRNNVKYGFEPVIPPYLVTEKAMYNASNLPKFRGDFYEIPAYGLSLIPTAEVNLTNIYANKILNAKQLPLRTTAWTSCFRSEAGTYGALERGLIRIHQFEKCEIYSITEPEKSNDELEMMVACGEAILQMLGLHYRISLLATQDCSFASSKTYDIEVWLPGQQQYYEVSSCSNCTDFQARRAQIRYRKHDDEKPVLVHTLNASSLALPRLMVALMETYQQADGSIVLPDVLQKEMDLLW